MDVVCGNFHTLIKPAQALIYTHTHKNPTHSYLQQKKMDIMSVETEIK